MKILQLDDSYFRFPDGMDSVEEFVDFVNSDSPKFTKMIMLSDDHSVAPYFIEEERKVVHVNCSQVKVIEEIDGHVMPRAEYKRRLLDVVRKKCVTCAHFNGNSDELVGHYERLRLDGYCWGYEKMQDDDK